MCQQLNFLNKSVLSMLDACAEVLAELLTLCEHRKPRHGMDTASLGPSAAVAQQAMTVPSNALGSGQSMQELQSSIGTILGIPSSSLNET